MQESGRLVITRLLVNAFRTILALTPKDLLPIVYLCTGAIAPAHEGIELGIGDAILIKVCMAQCCWSPPDASLHLVETFPHTCTCSAAQLLTRHVVLVQLC